MKRQVPAFTLLEMIVVLAIAALIIGIGAGAVMQWEESTSLREAARKAEGVIMQAKSSSVNATEAQMVNLEELADGMRLDVRRAGAADFVPAAGQRLRVIPGGLCEPLSLRWQHKGARITATPDPLTGAFAQMEEQR